MSKTNFSKELEEVSRNTANRLNLIGEEMNLQERLDQIAIEKEGLRKSAGDILLRFKCSFDDDWSVVVGVKTDLSSAFPVMRSAIHNPEFDVEDNILTGFDALKYNELIFINPIFFREIGISELLKTHPKYLARKYEYYFAAANLED